jgi:hypothetical protein
MDNTRYYVRDRTAVQGPFDLNELGRRVKTRRLARHHHVSVDRAEWRRAVDALPELFQSAAGPTLHPDNSNEPIVLVDEDPFSLRGDPLGGERPPLSPDPRLGNPIPGVDPGSQARPRNWAGYANVAILALAILGPLLVVGGLVMLMASGSTTDKSIARDVGACLATVQGIHPQKGKTECYAILVSRNQLVAPILAATLDGLKVETRHKDGHAEWHSAHLLTADPVTGLCVLRADCGREVTFMKLPESRTFPERRASLRLVLPDPDDSRQIERGSYMKVLNEGEPDESLQVEFDDRPDESDDPLGRAVVDARGVLVGMVVGRLPDETAICAPAYEIRTKKKEAGKFPADHVLKRIDLPELPVPGTPPSGEGSVAGAPGTGMEKPEGATPTTASDAPDSTKETVMPKTTVDLQTGNVSLPQPAGEKQRSSRDEKSSKPATTGGVAELVRDAVDTAIPLPPLPPETAKELGDELRNDVLTKHRVARDKAVSKKILLIANSVLVAAGNKPEDYRVTVVEDDAVQAYAFVGDNIIVNTGFLDFAGRDDDMIRFVIAHEIGHLVKGHVEKPFRRELLAGRLVPGVQQVGDTLNTVLKNSPYNQADEEEADCFAVEIHRKKKWSLEGGVRFFKRIRDEESRSNDKDAATGTIDVMFSSHPDHERRIEMITNGCDP